MSTASDKSKDENKFDKIRREMREKQARERERQENAKRLLEERT